MKLPWMDPRLRELIALAALAAPHSNRPYVIAN